jgi:hypothetical protein
MNNFLSFSDGLSAVPHGVFPHWTPTPQSFVVSLTSSNDAKLSKKMQKCATHNSRYFPRLALLGNWQLDVRSRTPETGKSEPGFYRKHPRSANSGTPETFVLEMTKNNIIPGKLDIIVNAD